MNKLGNKRKEKNNCKTKTGKNIGNETCDSKNDEKEEEMMKNKKNTKNCESDQKMKKLEKK